MLRKKTKPRENLEIRLCKSYDTGKLYIGLFNKETPLKYWNYDDISPAGIDILNELIKGYDLGYDITFQFPQNKGEKKVLVPRIVKMYNEPETPKTKKNVEEEFFDETKQNENIMKDIRLDIPTKFNN